MPWRESTDSAGRDRKSAVGSRARISSSRVGPLPPSSQDADTRASADGRTNSSGNHGKKSSLLRGPHIVPVHRLRRTPTKEKFLRAFGVLGVPLALVICVSTGWTAWLVVLNIAPNATANFLMNTGNFDNGAFWLIIDPDPALLVVTCLGLAAVLLGLSGVIFGERVVSTWGALTGFNGTHRKFWNAWLKVLDLALQILTLHQILEAGLPVAICYFFAILTAANCFSCGVVILAHTRLSAFTEVIIDTAFDMLFAVGAPILLLAYSYYNFHFDRASAHLVIELASSGSFERQARMSADPVQVTLFLISFNGLRIRSALNFFLRIGMNLSFAYRLKRIIEVTAQKVTCAARSLSSQQLSMAGEQKAVPKWAAVLFFALGCMLLVYTRIHRCPCLVMIDADRAPKTYAEWENPPDVTETLRALALSGDLQVLEVTNQRLRTLPEELHRCSRLRHISLMHTGIQVIPNWAKDFKLLEFLNVEGRSDDVNLVEVPDDLFAHMAALTYFHLGVHQSLARLPSFRGAPHLKTVSLALLSSLQTLPSLAPLQQLKNLELIMIKGVRALPELTGMPTLQHFVTLNAAVCCNGELKPCNSSTTACAGGAECAAVATAEGELTKTGAAVRSLVAERFPQNVCTVEVVEQRMLELPSRESVDACGGVQFRQCAGGVCYSDRLHVIACSANEAALAVRRAQIARGIGPACDPAEERWLGCA